MLHSISALKSVCAHSHSCFHLCSCNGGFRHRSVAGPRTTFALAHVEDIGSTGPRTAVAHVEGIGFAGP